MLSYAPGARVVVRDEEWLIRRVDPSSDGGYLLNCDGVSDLVRGRSALFLTKLEGDSQITVLDPARTELVADSSSHFNSTFLYLEAKLRQSTPNDDRIHLGHRGVMNLTPYQLDPALQALRQPRQRILIADAVGLGKTLEAGILASELIARGRGQRILVITLKSMLTQFQKEFWSRFSIPLVRLDSLGLQRVRNQIPSNHNPFNYYDRSIISIDTLKNNLEYRNYLENAWWDIIIIDECHNVAARAGESGLSRRARLARMLSSRSDTLILLSATPHDGSARSFASLMTLLDPTAISDPDDYTPDDYQGKGLVIRRFKKDIRDQVAEDFKDRITEQLRHPASPEEEAAYEALLAIPFTQKGKRQVGKQQELQRVGMQKGIFSSPAAALESTKRRIRLLEAGEGGPNPEEQAEITALQVFAEALEKIDASRFSKFQRLVTQLKDAAYGWNPSDAADRLVIFSERIETLEWLLATLPGTLGMKADQFQILHVGMSDTEQQEIVERFGRKDDTIRVLLCSDVASEGLNLHYFCHRLIHFDLPWSLMVFQQRNGRVDRYGQRHQPRITYLFTETAVERIKGDLRILESLQTKDEQANKNLGDPASFLHVYDPDKEAAKVEDAMAEHVAPEAFEEELDQNAARADAAPEEGEEDDGEWLMTLFSGGGGDEPDLSTNYIDEPLSLFGDKRSDSDYAFAKTALQQLSVPDPIAQFNVDDEHRSVSITAPSDLQDRLKLGMPAEVRDKDHRYTLTADNASMADAIERARQARRDEDTWPAIHYLWPQHPIMEWLTERVLAGLTEWLLLDRYKWPNNRLLRFDWTEILDRKDNYTLQAAAALLHRDSLAPESGESLLEGLDANAHKHAFGVSEDLKYALRSAIELLGNEAVTQLRKKAQDSKQGFYSGKDAVDPGELSLECLRLVYRLMFLFYIEARPELGYVPIQKSEIYAKGYSLESLRDLEMVPLQTTEARDGRYFDATLRQLFRLVREGCGASQERALVAGTEKEVFSLAPLDSRLFDEDATPLLNEVTFPNHVWQEVIRGMSLSRGRRRGRVSYQLLSINQLGAVYEALLSYRGFFAPEDLYEVKPAPKKKAKAAKQDDDDDSDDDEDDNDTAGDDEVTIGGDELESAWFVPASRIKDYKPAEIVHDLDDQKRRTMRKYPRDTFIYRLAGRDRQKSASYYTPQVLTRCLVKYALKELLQDKKADDILRLTICEPAMGSAAFINEAVNQLAEAYLERKQAELKKRIPHEIYATELQKVRMFIADRNAFGVDLNPIATELAEVSIWLNAIYGEPSEDGLPPKPARVPWFGYQLFTGNSLVGARREVYPAASLREKKADIGNSTGNRFDLAKALGDLMVKAADAESPWAAFSEQADRWTPANLKRIAEEWPPKAAEKFSIGDFTIKDVADYYAAMQRRVVLLTGDQQLAAYEPPAPALVPRRRKLL